MADVSKNAKNAIDKTASAAKTATEKVAEVAGNGAKKQAKP